MSTFEALKINSSIVFGMKSGNKAVLQDLGYTNTKDNDSTDLNSNSVDFKKAVKEASEAWGEPITEQHFDLEALDKGGKVLPVGFKKGKMVVASYSNKGGAMPLHSSLKYVGTQTGSFKHQISEANKVNQRVLMIRALVQIDEEELMDEVSKITNNKGQTTMHVLKELHTSLLWGGKLPWR